MKSKFYLVCAFAICVLMGFTSCSDSDENENNGSQTEMADYTVIFWGSVGDNEANTISDMSDLLLMRENGKITNKVNLVGCIDPTMKYSKALVAKNLGGTIEFELGTKRNIGADTLSVFKKCAGFANARAMEKVDNLYKGDDTYINADHVETYAKVFASMKSCKASSTYDIYSSESLKKYIAKAAKEHPAKNYVLLLFGHGTGYVPAMEGNASASASTRYCISSTDGKHGFLTLDDVANAITDSDVEVKSVFYQCCQMASLEVFATMKNCTDYVVASAEPTEGGYFPQFIKNLSEAGATDEGLKTACKKTVDFYVDDCVGISGYRELSSHGFYDLTKMDELLKPVSEASAWFASAAKTNPEFMDDVVFGSVLNFSNSLTAMGPQYTYEVCHNYQTHINEALRGGELDAADQDEVLNIVGFVSSVNHKVLVANVFASMMEKALSDDLKAEAEGLDRVALTKIYNDYMSALKKMAYIRCNGSEDEDAAYRHASPTVNLFCMNEKGYHCYWTKYEDIDERVDKISEIICDPLFDNNKVGGFNKFVSTIGGTILAEVNPSLADVKATYQDTDFDKATGWSKVLENINVNPLFLVNPTRYDVIKK